MVKKTNVDHQNPDKNLSKNSDQKQKGGLDVI